MIEYFLREAQLKFALIGFVIIWASRMNWAHLENTNTSRNTNIGPKNIAKDWNHKLFYQNKLADWKRKYECRSHPWHNHQLPRVIISVAPPGPPLSLSPQNFCQSSVIWLMEDRSVRPSHWLLPPPLKLLHKSQNATPAFTSAESDVWPQLDSAIPRTFFSSWR